jgi:hypothetical protein
MPKSEARWFIALFVALALVCAGIGGLDAWQRSEAAKAKLAAIAQAKAAAAAKAAKMYPPPVLHKGKPVWKGKRKMATWTATGAGDSSYNGDYVESGTHNSEPSYVLNAGGANERWLYKSNSSPLWILGSALVDPPFPPDATWAYSGDTTLHPGAWSIVSPPGGSTAPAPTLATYAPPPDPDPFTWPYTYHWWADGDAPFIPPKTTFAPCRATIDSVAYVAFPSQDEGGLLPEYGFSLYRESDDAWLWCPAGAALLALWDPYQSGGCFDAGDDGSVHLCSGSYDDTGAYFTFSTFALVADTSATQTATDTIALAALDITNLVQTATGVFSFVMIDGADVKLCSYTAGDATHSVTATFSSVAALPTGYTAVVPDTDRTDQVLFRRTNGTLYWMRHCTAAGQHRVVVYEVSAAECTQLADVILTTATDSLQTWGNYTAGGCVVGDIGSKGWTSVMRWQPGRDGWQSAPFAAYPAARHWYIDGTPLLVAGWAETVFDTRPFVLEAAPETISVPLVASAAAVFSPSIRDLISVPLVASAVEVFSPTIVQRDIINVPLVASAVEVFSPRIVAVTSRAPSASDAEWSWVRVRAGV